MSSTNNPNPTSTEKIESISAIDDADTDAERPSDHIPLSSAHSEQNDSKHYDGVYYGSSDDDVQNSDIDLDLDVQALLSDIAEPDENEEPYDILADNGEFSYSEQDQRSYMQTSFDDMLPANADSATSQIMMPISEEHEEQEEEEREKDGEGKVDDAASHKEEKENEAETGTKHAPTNQSRSSQKKDIVFHSGRGTKHVPLQNRRLSPPTPMYQMPNDYSIQLNETNRSSDWTDDSGGSSDSEDSSSSNSSSSSSMVADSIKQTVRDIDDVLDSMQPAPGVVDGVDRTDSWGGPLAMDDTTIVSDVSAGATTKLSGELEKAQEIFFEFAGIDASNFKGPKKKKKPKPKPAPILEVHETENDGATRARIANIASWLGVAVAIGVLFAIYIATRDNESQTSVAPNIRGDDLNTSMPVTTFPSPTLLPVAEDGDGSSYGNDIGISGEPSMDPSTESSPAPALRPSNRPLGQPASPALTAATNSLSPPSTAPTGITEISSARVPSEEEKNEYSSSEEEDKLDDEKDYDDQTSFGVPENGGSGSSSSSSSSLPWDDDDFIPTEIGGNDDFYSNDDAYEYELHHPTHHYKSKTEKKTSKYAKVHSYYSYYSHYDSYYSHHDTPKKETKSHKGYYDSNYYSRNYYSKRSPPQQQQEPMQRQRQKPQMPIPEEGQPYTAYHPLPPPSQQQQQQKLMQWQWQRQQQKPQMPIVEEGQPYIVYYPLTPQQQYFYQQQYQQQHRQQQTFQQPQHQQHDSYWDRSPSIVRESITRIRKRQIMPGGY